MVRAPCCDKSGLKKGPWSADEDQILLAYVTTYGHANWRALPKQAGLLRCGKSCRLRWTNYLRPHIKRGNFTKEEEDIILTLHQNLGNRWSAIAARLPGRTDNEIKNVWHTHIKKRLIKQNDHAVVVDESKPPNIVTSLSSKGKGGKATMEYLANTTQMSPEWSDVSSSSATGFSSMSNSNATMVKQDHQHYCMFDESFWSEALSTENSNICNASIDVVVPMMTTATTMINEPLPKKDDDHDDDDSMSFWLSILMEAGDF